MPSEGPADFLGADTDSSVGTLAWSDAANCLTANDTPATVSGSTSSTIEATHYLMPGEVSWDTPIPAAATIDGILVEIRRKVDGIFGDPETNYARDNRVRLIKGGTIQTEDKAATATDWTGAYAYSSHGGVADDWGDAGLTGADLNDAGFGVAISVNMFFDAMPLTASIDHVRVTATFTEGGGVQKVARGVAGGMQILTGGLN